MGKATTRDLLLEAGRRTFLQKGFNNAGLDGILQTAGVPKGSFYYYFGSKEDFGLEVLDRFDRDHREFLDRVLGDESLPPLERLRRYFESICERLESCQCREGCLIGNLGQEMADHSEAFRARLEGIFAGWVDRYAACLAQGQDRGEIATTLDARELAEFWLNSWQGALLRAKTMRSSAPLRTFLHVMFGYVAQARV
jgi:TetR/AcrR family transcriptional repressor of nem operon